MKSTVPFTCRGVRSEKRWAATLAVTMLLSSVAGPGFFRPAVVKAQAPVGSGFTLNAGDLRFIFRQIQIAQAHAAGGDLLGPGPNQVSEPRLPFGLRTVDGSFNHLVPGQTKYGAADQIFPRMGAAAHQQAEPWTIDPDGPGPLQAGSPSSYTQKRGLVNDAQPRIISNLVNDQTVSNPAAVAASGYSGPTGEVQPEPLGTLPIPDIAPDGGLSAPFNSMFTFFGQFFDHGLDLVTKGGGTVFVPLQPDDPLYVPGSNTNFMVLTRATNRDCTPGPGCIPDGVGDNPATPQDESANDVMEATNTTTPFVDQNQTYTSHPSHQVFLREYELNAQNRPVATGRLIDGAIPGNIGNWAEVKAQARAMLGIALTDADVFNVPLLQTDPYGRFVRGPARGLPVLVLQNGQTREGNLAAPVSTAGAALTGHAFLDDIAHNAAPAAGLQPDADLVAGSTTAQQPDGTYDNELLDAHFVTGDGRGNENIALTAVHAVFHLEHNRLATQILGLLPATAGSPANTLGFTQAELDAWRALDAPSGWDFGERLFQAARFVTEMQYQHLVFEEFARKLVPSINAFIGDGINFRSDTNPAIRAEFAHAVYRLGHSMLTETIARTNPANGQPYDIPLLDGFLNPLEFNRGPGGIQLSASQAAGAIFQGGTRQIGNMIDEFVTEAVRNRLLGLPLDLAVLNIARGRSEGLPSLNALRRQIYAATNDIALAPYSSWFDFGFALKHAETLDNLIAAYGIHPSLQMPAVDTDNDGIAEMSERRAAAAALLQDATFMFGDPAATGLENVDLWVGGLAEKIAPFGGMLGPTFNYVFEIQLENLQDGDRFYYLERLDGLNLLSQLEGNSFAELIQRNTSLVGNGIDAFGRPDLVLNLDRIAGPGNTIIDDPTTLGINEATQIPELVRLPNGAFRYSGPLHVIMNGSNTLGDRMISSEGDDSLIGNGGNDRIEGGAGNDQPVGGAGDDIITDLFGDDVIKGGPGNDAISGGSGPFDLLQGNEGNDFIVGGPDDSEVFGGLGNDVIYMGAGLSESVGGAGDDWMEGTNAPASIAIGDDNNQFQNDPNGGNDIGVAGPADMDFDMEGGDDIMVGTVLPTHRFEGMLGFDWATYRGEVMAVDADMLITGAVAANAPLNENRDRFDNTEGLSGTNFNDLLRGDDRDAALLTNDGLTGVANGHVLTAAGIARIAGLATILPAGATSFAAGNIILGGSGNDILEGRGGDDILDGDRWLNVQLRGVLNDGTVVLANRHTELRDHVFADPQRLNPGNITFVRSIVVGAPGVDTAVFSGQRSEYIVTTVNGVTTVDHQGGADGVDTLRNIERLQFADVTETVQGAQIVTVPTVTALTQQQATTAITGAGLVLGTVTTVQSATVPAGRVISQSPAAGQLEIPGNPVSLVVSVGPVAVVVPTVVGLTQQAATTAIANASLALGTITQSSHPTVPAGSVISQSPDGGVQVVPGSAVSLQVSTGAGPANPGGLVLWLRFDEAAGATAADSSPSNLPGTVLQAQFVPGRFGNALQFDGVNDWVTVNDAAPLDLTTGMTVSAWVNPTVLSGWETAVMKENGVGQLSYALYARDGAPFVGGAAGPGGYIRSGGVHQVVNSTLSVPLNAWSYITTTYDGFNQRIYVNGVLAATRVQTGNIQVGTGPLRIGGNNAWAGEFFQGRIDEVRVYNRALSAAEIQTDMNTGAPAPVTTIVPGVVGQTQGAAQTAITAAGLTSTVVTQNNAAPAGQVIAQNPAGGTTVLQGSNVALTVSLGPAPVTVLVPGVVGQTQAAAQTAITAVGLTSTVVTQNNAAPAGQVIAQNPTGGTAVAPGSNVQLTVSLGPAQVAVPAVVGLTQGAATTAITGAGLVVGTVTQQANAAAAGTVLSSTPTQGTLVNVGSAVNLVVSSGPAPGGADPTVVVNVVSNGQGVRVTPAFSAPAGATLVAFVGADGPNAVASQAATVSGAGLTWTLRARANTRRGVAEIWTAVAAAALTNVTVTSTTGAGETFQHSLRVIGFTNVSAVGAVATAGSAGTNLASASLVTQGAGSVVFGVGSDWTQIVARTIPAGQTAIGQYTPAGAVAVWTQRLNGITGAAGSTVTLNTTAPTSPEWNMAIIELRR